MLIVWPVALTLLLGSSGNKSSGFSGNTFFPCFKALELDFKEAYLLTPWPTAPITAPSVNDNAASPNESISPFIASTAKLEAAPVIVALARGPTPGIGIAETAPLTAPDNTALPNPSFQSLSWRTLSITLAAPLINAPTPAPIPIAAKKAKLPSASTYTKGLLWQYV